MSFLKEILILWLFLVFCQYILFLNLHVTKSCFVSVQCCWSAVYSLTNPVSKLIRRSDITEDKETQMGIVPFLYEVASLRALVPTFAAMPTCQSRTSIQHSWISNDVCHFKIKTFINCNSSFSIRQDVTKLVDLRPKVPGTKSCIVYFYL